MKNRKMYLLFACLIGITVACQKNHDVVPGNSGSPDLSSQNFSSQDVISSDNVSPENDATARHIEPDDFVQGVDNPFFPLTPGTTYHYLTTIIDGQDTSYENVSTHITHQTKVIQGVTCMVVHDVVSWAGTLLEDTYDWYAQDEDGNVWYFGEDTKKYDENGNVSTEGSWESGEDGAKAGYIMWAHPRAHIGQTYKQEYYAGVAEDKAKVINGHVNETVPYGSFQNCIKIKEFTPLDPGINEFKFYKAGVGQLSAYVPDEGETEVLISITQ